MEDEKHVNRPRADAPHPREPGNQFRVVDQAGFLQGRDRSVPAFGVQIAHRQQLVARKPGPAQDFVRAEGDRLMERAVPRLEFGQDPSVNRGRRLAVELLVDDGAEQRLEEALGPGRRRGKGALAVDQDAEDGIAGPQMPQGFVRIEGVGFHGTSRSRLLRRSPLVDAPFPAFS